MSDKKISDLVELGTLAADDVLPVVDASANATKRVTYDTLATEVRSESEPLSATTVTASGDVSADTATIAGDVTSNGETVFHRGNVVGTVSQSGGTPTGAIIEQGENGNGEFVKYADGTMIVSFRDGGQTYGDLNGSGQIIILVTFPVPFANTSELTVIPSVSVSGSAGGANNFSSPPLLINTDFSNFSTTSFEFSIHSAGNGGVGTYISYVAIGRWF